jgi:hypothetical protein
MPYASAHRTAGNVILRNVWNGDEPSVAAACSCSVPISSSTGTSSRTTSGNDTKTVAITMPGNAKITLMPRCPSHEPIGVSRP